MDDCGATLNPVCADDLTAMIECEGDKGDSSGESQRTTETVTKVIPTLGILPLPNPYLLNCYSLLLKVLF